MGDVGLMVDRIGKVVGWIVIYFIVGLWVARKVNPPTGMPRVETRILLAFIWPVVATWLGVALIGRNLAQFFCDVVRSVLRWMDEDTAKRPPPAPDAPAPPVDGSPYRGDTDEFRLIRLHQEREANLKDRDRINREIGEICKRLEAKGVQRSPPTSKDKDVN
ncbi:MAG: hypothetical protein AAB668_01720 [Patescibacteria group bacterium]